MAPLRSQPGAAFVIGKGGAEERADDVFAIDKLPDYYIAFGPVCQLNFFSRTQKNSEKSVDTGDILW